MLCFRYGTADLCRDHCFIIGDLLASSQITASPECTHVTVLFRRLFNFMAPEHHVSQYFSACSPRKNVVQIFFRNVMCEQQYIRTIILPCRASNI